MARGSVRLLPWDEGGGEGVRERERELEFCFVCERARDWIAVAEEEEEGCLPVREGWIPCVEVGINPMIGRGFERQG